MAELEDDALRDAAAHRALKLIKSRKRKPGVGAFGRYGLADVNGEKLLGFGDDGLIATLAEIRDYLRKSELSTWAQSAELTPESFAPDRAKLDTADTVVHRETADSTPPAALW